MKTVCRFLSSVSVLLLLAVPLTPTLAQALERTPTLIVGLEAAVEAGILQAHSYAPAIEEARADVVAMENLGVTRQQLDAMQAEMWDLVDAARGAERTAVLARLHEAMAKWNAMENALALDRQAMRQAQDTQAQPVTVFEPPSEYIAILQAHARIINALRAADAAAGDAELRESAMARTAALVSELTDVQRERMFAMAQARANAFVPPQRDPNEVWRTGWRPLVPGAQLVGIDSTPERITYRLISPDRSERGMHAPVISTTAEAQVTHALPGVETRMPPSPDRDKAYARLAERYFVWMDGLQRHVTQLESEVMERGHTIQRHTANGGSL
jgi:hypothetical protein